MTDIIAIIVAILALIVSILSPIIEFICNKKINRINLSAEYFKDVYGTILHQDIPVALNYLHYDGQKLSGTNKLIDVLRELRTKSLYFKVVNGSFYKKLLSSIQNLEDYIVSTDDTMTSMQYYTFLENVIKKIEDIYIHMNNQYIGKKQIKE